MGWVARLDNPCCIKGVSEQLRGVYKQFGIPAYFKPSNTLRQLLVRRMDKILKERVVGPVYHIDCEQYEVSYMEKWIDLLRLSSRNTDAQALPPQRSPTTFTTFIDIEKAMIVPVEPQWFERGVKEAVYIRARKPSLNRDGGRFNLPVVWTNLLEKHVRGPGPGTSKNSSSIVCLTCEEDIVIKSAVH